MGRKIIKQRIRYFLAVEGEGEQSFVTWLQRCFNKKELHIYLDCHPLGGGGYEKMLNDAVRSLKKKEKVQSSILLVDADRSPRDDKWSLDQLRKEAFKKGFNVVFQVPNLEGVLLRMLPNKERLQPAVASKVYKQLRQAWPSYQKPADASTLDSKFSLDDLYRVANVDLELKTLLSILGLKS